MSSGPPPVKGAITTPASAAAVVSPIAVSGWAIEPLAGSGTGVDSIAVWVCEPSNCGATMSWKGWGTYGSARSDVAATYGSQFLNSGWTYTLAGLTPGTYGLMVYAHNTVSNDWDLYQSTFTLVTSSPQLFIDGPTANQAVSQPFTIYGWAADVAVPTGTGVDSVDVYAYPNPGSGASLVHLGTATYGGARSDVSAVYGAQFLNTGYTRSQSGLTAGQYQILVYAHDTLTDTWELRTGNTYVDLSTATLTIDRSGTGTGAVTATGLTCAGGSGTQAVPCSANYTQGASVTLTASPDSGSTFAGWAGPCTGTSTCSVTMATAKYVSATFTKTPTTVTLTYYHTDMIGSVRAITDEAGATVIRHDYGPFGEDTQPMTGDPLRFGGKELDPETGLANFEARYYRQILGRFAAVDPVNGAFAAPQTLNRYSYALNNPLRFIDPDGMAALGIKDEITVIGFYRQVPSIIDDLISGGSDDWGGPGRGRGRQIPRPGGGRPGGGIPSPILAPSSGPGPGGEDGPGPGGIGGPPGFGTPSGFAPGPQPSPDGSPESDRGDVEQAVPTPIQPPCTPPLSPPGVSLAGNVELAHEKMDSILQSAAVFGGDPWLEGIIWFRDQMRNKGPWDFKQLTPRGAYENFGNYHYGFVGTKIGFSGGLLLRAAGYAQRKSGTSKPEWSWPFGSAPFGDDPLDQVLILAGINDAKGCGN